MSRDMKNNPRASKGSQRKPSVLPGILVGLIIGLAVAIGVFYVVSQTPPRFDNLLEQQHRQASAASSKLVKPEVLAPIGADSAKNQQRYDFYTILPANGETVPASGTTAKAAKPAPAAKTDDGADTEVDKTQFLQVGSFQNADDADNLKARLSMDGLEVQIQTSNLGDLGVRHRVRVGPLHNAQEVQQARAVLSRESIAAIPTKD